MRRLLLATACAALLSQAAAAQTLRVALREDADILDPTLARTYVGRIVFAGLCDKLFDINEKLEIVPQLATGYEWTDPITLVIHLRQGVKFQDGTGMDAAAVKYSLDRHVSMQGSFRRSELSTMDRVEVVDPQTVRIVLKTPSSPFLAQLADRSGMIVSPKAAEAAGKDFGLHPVCAGPFAFKERVPQDRIVLERFPGYWDADRIKLERVVYQPIPDSSIRLANLQAGSVELVEFVLPTDVDAVRKNPRLKIAITDYLGYQGLTFNVANGPRSKAAIAADPRLRRAFELSLDRDALVQVVYAGLYTPTAQAVSPSSPYFIADVKPPARDIAKAKALMKEAGVTGPVPVDMMVPNNPDLRQAAEVIQSMAAEAGFDVRITATEFASALQAESRGDYVGFILAWSGRVDPDGNLYSFLHTGGALNTMNYSNPAVDKALDDARLTADVPKRRELYAAMWAAERQDLPILYLWTQKNIAGLSAKVEGFRPMPDGMIRLQGVSLAK